jgi:hypothetical protein
MMQRLKPSIAALLGSLFVAGGFIVPAERAAVASAGHPDRAAVVRVADGHLTWLIRTGPGGGPAQVTFTFGVAGDL